MRRLTTCLVPLCAVVHAVVAAADAGCPQSITSECFISRDEPAKGPRYRIPANASGMVNVRSDVTAKGQGEVFLVTGKSPLLTIEVEEGKTLKADKTVILLERGASLKKVRVFGTLDSKSEHAFKVSAGAEYNLDITDEKDGKKVKSAGEVRSASEQVHAVRINGAARGSIILDGKITGGHGGGILYSSEVDDPRPLGVGDHTLTVASGALVSATGSRVSSAAISVGSSVDMKTASVLPVYHFNKMEVLGTVKGKSAAIALNHGELRGDNWTIGETGRVEGEKAAIRLGKVANNISHGRFSGTIANNGSISASAGPAIIAEGDISASIINSGTIESKGAAPAALDFSGATRVLNYTQTRGKTVGAIVGHKQHKANVIFNGGSFSGDIRNARSFRINNQVNLHVIDGFTDQLHVKVHIPGIVAGVAKDLAFDLVKGKYKGELHSAKMLTIAPETELQLTHPIKLSEARVDGVVGLDLNTLGSKDAYVDAEGVVKFGPDAEVELHIRGVDTGKTYPLFKGSVINDLPKALTTTNKLLEVEGRKTSGNLYEASFTRNAEKFSEKLRQLGASGNQIRAVEAYTTSDDDAVDDTTKMLSDAYPDGDELLQRSRELVPPTQTVTRTLQTTAMNVASRIQDRLAASAEQRTGMFHSDLDHGFWIQVHKDDSDQVKQKEHSGHKGEQTGLTVGFDAELEQLVNRAGFAFTTADVNVEYKKSRNRLSSDLRMFTVYGSMPVEFGDLSSQFSFGQADNISSRYVRNAKHKADYSSSLVKAQLQLQNAELLAQHVPVALVAGLNITHVNNNKHRYKGEFLKDRVKGSDGTAFELGLGLRYNGGSITENLIPRVSLMGWFDLNNDKLDTRYSVASGPVITIRGPDKKRLTATGQFGLDYLRGNLVLGADITSVWRSGFSDLGVLGRIRYEF